MVQNYPVDSWGLFHLAALGRAWPSLACPKLCFVLPTRTIVTHFDPCSWFLLQALNPKPFLLSYDVALLQCLVVCSGMIWGSSGDGCLVLESLKYRWVHLSILVVWTKSTRGVPYLMLAWTSFNGSQRPQPKIGRSGKLAGCNLCGHLMMSRPRDLCLETQCPLLPWFTLWHSVNNSNTNASASSFLHGEMWKLNSRQLPQYRQLFLRDSSNTAFAK